MLTNIFKQRLLHGQRQIGIWSMLANATVLEVMTQADFDWVLIDTEHAPNELPMVIEQLRAVAQTDMPAVVRPAANDTVIIKRLLDIGAQSILVPMIETAEDARRAAAAVRYPPEGVRGVSTGTRANRYGRDTDYLARANREVCLMVQIESRLGLENLEQIAAVDGIDALFIGPSDLAADLGHLGNFKHPEVQQAIHDAFSRSRACAKPIGILMPDQKLATEYIRLGFDYLAVATDIGILRAGTEAALKHFRSL